MGSLRNQKGPTCAWSVRGLRNLHLIRTDWIVPIMVYCGPSAQYAKARSYASHLHAFRAETNRASATSDKRQS